MNSLSKDAVFVVIPAFKCRNQIGRVIDKVPAQVKKIIVVDDCCPEGTGKSVEQSYKNNDRVKVIFHTENQGVGGAMVTGFQAALEQGAQIVIKIDGDDQMDPGLIPDFIEPIVSGRADYTKGNRFFFLDDLKQMPGIRLFGNAVLSFFNKLVSGYWNTMDPTNGYVAIHTDALRHIPLTKLSKRYFFESDLLFRLGIMRAVVEDVPMSAKYADEVSNLRISNVVFTFPPKYLIRFLKRIFYCYFLRDFTAGSLFLVSGVVLCGFGTAHALYHWFLSMQTGVASASGTVMLSALLLLFGFQMVLFFFQQDIASVPHKRVSRNLK